MLAATPSSHTGPTYRAERLRERILRLNARCGSGPLCYFDDPLIMARTLWASAPAGHILITGTPSPAACVLDLVAVPGWRGQRNALIAGCMAAAAAIARLVPPMPLIVITEDAELVRLLVESDAWIAGVLAPNAIEAEWREVLRRVAAYELGRAAVLDGAGAGSLAHAPLLTR